MGACRAFYSFVLKLSTYCCFASQLGFGNGKRDGWWPSFQCKAWAGGWLLLEVFGSLAHLLVVGTTLHDATYLTLLSTHACCVMNLI
jgi:hypothetical protein